MVEMVVEEADRDALGAAADELSVLGLWRERLDDGHVLLRLLVESERTEAVIGELESRFQMRPGFRLVIFEVQATVPQPEPSSEASSSSPRSGDESGESDETFSVAWTQTPGDRSGGEGREGDGDGAEAPEDQKPSDPARIACDELVQKLSGGAVINHIFVVTVVLSTVVAAIGLTRSDVAVIIGAMVIAPLLRPNMTLALATTLGDPKLARRALAVNATGLSVALVAAIAIGLLTSVDPQTPEIARRTQVSLSDIALALAAGSAGALAFTSGLSAAVVGVMVAVALLPPLVNVGLLLGGGFPFEASEALLLTATNIVCINVAAVGTFLWQKVHPRHWWKAERAKRMVRVAAAVWLGLLALLVGLIVLASRSSG